MEPESESVSYQVTNPNGASPEGKRHAHETGKQLLIVGPRTMGMGRGKYYPCMGR